MEKSTNEPTYTGVYDKVRVREYLKIKKGWIFSSEEIVHSDKIFSELRLEIKAPKRIGKIVINGEEYVKINEII